MHLIRQCDSRFACSVANFPRLLGITFYDVERCGPCLDVDRLARVDLYLDSFAMALEEQM
jgi:hypothetical protein